MTLPRLRLLRRAETLPLWAGTIGERVMTTEAQMREQFEKWAKSKGCGDGKYTQEQRASQPQWDYLSPFTQSAWEGWRAVKALPVQDKRTNGLPEGNRITTGKVTWVRCPVCGEPDMRKEQEEDPEDNEGYILCTNLYCGSNGGDNFRALPQLDQLPILREMVRILRDGLRYYAPVYDKGYKTVKTDDGRTASKALTAAERVGD